MFVTTHLPRGFEVRMNSTLENVDRAIAVLRTFLEKNAADRHLFPLSLLAREALNNAVIHGNGLNAEKLVLFRVSRRGQDFRLEIADQGPGFDWRAHLGARSDISRENGRGHEIFRIYASAIGYNEHGTRVTLDYAGEQA
ncbi:MAG: ATP-binding protein [Deltaproteobacteria bacterium]|nr:ATP-binding protein [Deltaproteobacteria bacterium]